MKPHHPFFLTIGILVVLVGTSSQAGEFYDDYSPHVNAVTQLPDPFKKLLPEKLLTRIHKLECEIAEVESQRLDATEALNKKHDQLIQEYRSAQQAYNQSYRARDYVHHSDEFTRLEGQLIHARAELQSLENEPFSLEFEENELIKQHNDVIDIVSEIYSSSH